ncbi:restriction endonuclease subunit S [Senegalia sp. (in: firmicutes)]|uniref:restriction endonuclease subunit S n=1 Tax=Senegalia sp. (in: firmicutes) TaxID=1924098 RepID=UPI003F95853D
MYELKYRNEDEMKEIKDTWMKSIPNKWKMKKLSHISNIITGNTPSKKTNMYYKNGNIPWIKPDNIKEDYSISDTKEKLNKEGVKIARIIPPDSAIVCCIGTVGKVGVNKEEATTNQQINSVVFDKKNIWTNKYGIYSMISSRSDHEKYATKVVVAILNKTQQGNIKMPFPEIKEQQKIANFLDIKTTQFDSIISKKEKLIEKLEEAKKSLISEVVTGKVKIVDGKMIERKEDEMKDSGVEWLGMMPKNWEVTKAKYYMDIIGGYSFNTNEFSNEGVQVIKIANLYKNKLSLERQPTFIAKENVKKYNQFIINKNDILISLTGTLGKKDYGYAVLIEDNTKYLLNQRVGRIKIKKEIDLFYALSVLKSEIYLNQLYSYPSGTKQANLSNDDVLRPFILIPKSNKEQIELSFLLNTQTSKLDNIITKTKSQIQKLKEAKQSLISEAVTGKIDLRDWEIKN